MVVCFKLLVISFTILFDNVFSQFKKVSKLNSKIEFFEILLKFFLSSFLDIDTIINILFRKLLHTFFV